MATFIAGFIVGVFFTVALLSMAGVIGGDISDDDEGDDENS